MTEEQRTHMQAIAAVDQIWTAAQQRLDEIKRVAHALPESTRDECIVKSVMMMAIGRLSLLRYESTTPEACCGDTDKNEGN